MKNLISVIGLILSLALVLSSFWINTADAQDYQWCLASSQNGFTWNGIAGGFSIINMILGIILVVIFAFQFGSKK